MDESGFFRLLETLFPILIFLFWLLITFFANAKKGNPVPGTDNSSKKDSEIQTREKTPIGEELKRSLETIFGEMGGKTEKPLPKAEINKKTKKDKEPVGVIDTHILKAGKQETKAQEQIKLENAYQPYKENKITISLSHKDLRRAIILSEILAPPVSVRDE
ncbi:MAG TPA: hypothetical protein VKY57_16445 [Chitinispirillaceae bacterium]|nr:hypothetical protein [Chitinispirillaceae bacterium]